jgi:hypothetical protein
METKRCMKMHSIRGSIINMAALIAVAEVMGKDTSVILTVTTAATGDAWTTRKMSKCYSCRVEDKMVFSCWFVSFAFWLAFIRKAYLLEFTIKV